MVSRKLATKLKLSPRKKGALCSDIIFRGYKMVENLKKN